MKIKLLAILLILAYFPLKSQEKRELKAYRTNENIKIDGVLNETSWNNAPITNNFTQFEPTPNTPASVKIDVQIAYDDVAIYVAAKITDNPDSIFNIFTPRDADESADFFGVLIDTYNDGLKALSFSVSAAGVQTDIAFSGNNGDINWNAVWFSSAKITKTGWNVEMKIPYSELRFNASEIQKWGLNFFFNLRRKREFSAWNPINVEIDNFLSQNGELTDLKNIESPLRLSLMPYTTGYLIKSEEESKWGSNIKGGLDLKYGINESFTMDMMLIPDFGQVESDDEVLNLSAYETFYGEKRPFFMEGTELFSRADIFYSRRIGGTPQKYETIYDELNQNEEVTIHPSEIQLLNSTKISGKTSNGFSIGFLNSISGKSYATVVDTITGTEREYLMQALTNYNVSVFEKSLKNNSYISFINTNLSRFDDNYTANTTGMETKIYTNNKKYQLFLRGALSYKSNPDFDKETGFYIKTDFEKVAGNFRFEYENSIESDTYDPNDMGFVRQNNEFNNELSVSYQVFEPKYFYNNWNLRLIYEHQMLYEPRTYAKSYVFTNGRITFKNNLSSGFFAGRSLQDEHDFFEPRTDGYVYIQPWDYFYHAYISTNYAKALALDFGGGATRNPTWNTSSYSVFVSPRYRIGNRYSMNYRFNYETSDGSRGYVDNTETDVIFGQRDLQSITNSLDITYILSKDASFNLRFRHYWTSVEYQEFYTLLTNGTLIPNENYDANQNINFNALTINANLTWQFKPGSELSLVWKNELVSEDFIPQNDYFNNLEHTFELPQVNSISLRILYYIDYQNVSKLFK